jgi:hypothetical protein
MFDLTRFGRLALAQWAEYGRSYLWFLGIAVAVHLCTWLLITQGAQHGENYTADVQQGVFYAGYLLTGALFALRYFSALSNRDSALTCLMRPGSALEKFLLAFLIVAVLYPMAFLLAFELGNVPGAMFGAAARDVLVANGANPAPGYLRTQDYGPFLPSTGSDDFTSFVQLILVNLFVQAVVVAGTLYFRKIAWLKTTVGAFVLFVLVLPLFGILVDASPAKLFWNRFTPAHPGVLAWLVLVWIGVPLVMWASVFLLLRERQLR